MLEHFFIALLAGFSCAGKSTIGASLCKLYGFDFVNQQTIVHELARSNGYQRGRYWLRDVGMERFITESIDENVRRIRALERSNGVILDAVYGENILAALRGSFPKAKLAIVAVAANSQLREKRMMSRLGASRNEAAEELKFRDGFLSQAGLEGVMVQADIQVNNTGKLDDAIDQICQRFELFGFPPLRGQ